MHQIYAQRDCLRTCHQPVHVPATVSLKCAGCEKKAHKYMLNSTGSKDILLWEHTGHDQEYSTLAHHQQHWESYLLPWL